MSINITTAPTHPIPLNTLVEATRPTCQCRGAKMVSARGKVLKVITNHSGIWYYLDCGVTVKSDWIKSIIS